MANKKLFEALITEFGRDNITHFVFQSKRPLTVEEKKHTYIITSAPGEPKVTRTPSIEEIFRNTVIYTRRLSMAEYVAMNATELATLKILSPLTVSISPQSKL
jgi:hypothetical protein